MQSLLRGFAALLGLLLVAACGEEQTAKVPAPAELTRDAIGHYCNMIVEDHHGPKGQIYLADSDKPVWFSSVRDTIAFTLLPEEPKKIAAIYVNDMGRAAWDKPEAGTWIEATTAWYVIGSDRRGGMGAPEAVPFAERDAAEAFTVTYGGTVVAFADIPESEILGAVSEHGMHQGQSAIGHDQSMSHDQPVKHDQAMTGGTAMDEGQGTSHGDHKTEGTSQ